MSLILNIVITGLILGKFGIMEYSTYYILAAVCLFIDFIVHK